MLCNIKSGSYTISSVNEDSYGQTDGCVWVIDGATGLGGKWLPEEASDAQWYASAFSRYLSHALADRTRSLPRIFSDGVKQIWKEFAARTSVPPSCSAADLPCAVGAALRRKDGVLEYIAVGDCRILLRMRDGQTLELYDRRHEALDDESLRQMLQISQTQGLPLSQCKSRILPRLRQVRASINRPEGYISLCSDPESVLHAICGTVPEDMVTDGCLMSDGFAQYYALFHLAADASAFLDLAAKHSPEQLYHQLLRAQQGDPTLDRFPRFKLSDDATLVSFRCI